MNETRAVGPSLKIGLVALLGVALGSLLPRFFGQPSMPATASKAAEAQAITVRLNDEDKNGLRALVREELAQTLGAARAGASTSPSDAGSASAPSPSPAAAEAYKAARATIDKQITHGSWTDADRTQLRAILPALSSDARIEVIRPLLIAMNEGKVHFAGNGPPF